MTKPAESMMGPSPETQARYFAAADWLARRSLDDWTGDDARDFEAWQAADPENRAIVQRMMATWDAAGDLELSAVPAAAAPAARTSRPSWAAAPRRMAFALLFLCALVLAGAWQFHERSVVFSDHLVTNSEATRIETLPDGSTINVNRGTTLDISYSRARRDVTLVQGEAFFAVAPVPGQAFVIRSGGNEVTVVGTAFNVRSMPGVFSVQVEHGVVQVDHAGLQQPVRLHAGESFWQREGAAPQILKSTATAAGAWRKGRLEFRDTPLEQVLDALNLYLDQPVRLDDVQLGRLRVSGNADITAPLAFIRALPQLLPLHVEQNAGGQWMVSRR